MDPTRADVPVTSCAEGSHSNPPHGKSRAVNTPACCPAAGKFLVGFSPTLPTRTGARVCRIDIFNPLLDARGKQKKMRCVWFTNRARETLDLVLVTSNTTDLNNTTKHSFYNIKAVCSLTGIKVDQPHKKSIPGQCFNCQFYGHSSENYFQRARCVKCLGDHGTAASTRNKDTDGPPAGVLCKSSGHTANYLGCPLSSKRKINTINNNNINPPPIRAPLAPPAQAAPSTHTCGHRKHILRKNTFEPVHR
ncbi:hypothetical protein EVAR_31409_1 [Eumeta japonica]|uniref:Nucleic-acid-binding protein from transposon X-element n=1 Tax=Eumeta variegata TaxID=151549 RepID=A0A4C1UZQ9_EUMVA|nr:hypothetical protein EVAR_31409_1 [Eumeta japonica]